MTTVDIAFRYRVAPTEHVVSALASTRDVYGIRALSFDSANQILTVEYDATRLNPATVARLVKQCGLEVVEEVSLIPPQPKPEAVPATA